MEYQKKIQISFIHKSNEINVFIINLFVGGLEALKKGQMAVWVAGNKVYTKDILKRSIFSGAFKA